MFEGLFQPLHLLLVLGIALLVFGPSRLPELGKGLGEAIRGFKAALQGEPQASPLLPFEGRILLASEHQESRTQQTPSSLPHEPAPQVAPTWGSAVPPPSGSG
jgi:sec-independent protein translocase protein TatA